MGVEHCCSNDVRQFVGGRGGWHGGRSLQFVLDLGFDRHIVQSDIFKMVFGNPIPISKLIEYWPRPVVSVRVDYILHMSQYLSIHVHCQISIYELLLASRA